MNLHRWRTLLSAIIISVLVASASHADPILKPKKYHGPIPKRSFGLSIGFLSGADNVQMSDYLASLIDQPLQDDLMTEDFGPEATVDLIYTVKVHPQFAFRASTGASYLTSTSTGLAVATEPDTSGLLPLLQFERDFNVVLFSLAATGLYYFQDASVSEFQAYMGGGFTFLFPWATYEETTVEDDTGQKYSYVEVEHVSAEPGIHGLLGALYHIRNNVALFTEAKYQIGQSKFRMTLPTVSAGDQELSFDVQYSGFVLAIGASRFF